MNVGIFSGSFDPIHMGHMMIANYVTNFTDIDEVWFLVSPQNPFKKDITMTNEILRYRMVQLAVEDYLQLKASDFEFSLPRPSYTIHTLQELERRYPRYNFSLIIGADNWARITEWKDYQRILQNYKLYVYPRLGYDLDIADEYKESVTALESPIVGISSTFLRKVIGEGRCVRSFVPDSILEYIAERKLYTTNNENN